MDTLSARQTEQQGRILLYWSQRCPDAGRGAAPGPGCEARLSTKVKLEAEAAACRRPRKKARTWVLGTPWTTATHTPS